LTTRIYVSNKSSVFNLYDHQLGKKIRYRTNDNNILGIGYSYSFLTINVGFKLPFLNDDDNKYGQSKYLDLQTHAYFRDMILDFYLQWQKGYYLSNPEELYPSWDQTDSHPYRGDLRTNIVGLNFQYLFNSKRFSYKASFVQNQTQKKSAGSPILGMEAYWVFASADSAIVPSGIVPGFFDNKSYNQSDMFNFGINGGYAYTFVVREKFNLSLSSIFGAAAGSSILHDSFNSESYDSGIAFGVNNTTRASIGYNTKKFYIGFSYLRFSTNNMVNINGGWQSYTTQNLRFNVVKRFNLSRPIKILRPDTWIF
jgi:hypothetical protein